MYCPHCGCHLFTLEKQECPEVDWESCDDELINAQLEMQSNWDDEECDILECKNKKCSLSGVYLRYHGIHGYNSRPGDSWSITYLK